MPGSRLHKHTDSMAKKTHRKQKRGHPLRVQRLVRALRDLLAFAERNTCLHEETHRGGAIWEICDSCGMKWADDDGGKPANAHSWPKEIEYAQAAADEWKDCPNVPADLPPKGRPESNNERPGG